jgi:dihydrofolate reductase
MPVSLLVALTHEHRVIGRAGALPWRLSEDLKRFKRLTMGHHLVMGRKTYESIGRPLPGRTTIVITRNLAQLQPTLPEGVQAASSLDEAIQRCGDDPEIFVIGGGEIFGEALERADRAYVTWIDAKIEGDTFFPEFPSPQWRLVSQESVPADAKNEHPTRYCVYERVL